MQLKVDYLKERHNYWKIEIGEKKIWNPSLFKEIEIKVRAKSKCYNGLFSRRWIKKGGEIKLTDRIFIYNNSEDFDPVFLDSILVHEMIHQYITQAALKDTSTHGKLFKSFMTQINAAFPQRIQIKLKDHNPSVPLEGPGLTIHNLIISWTKDASYCCVIHPKKLREFDKMLKRYKREGIVKGYTWAQSLDLHFSRYVRCTKRLHGLRKSHSEMQRFCEKYKVAQIGEKWLTLR